MSRLTDWLTRKWQPQDQQALLRAYLVTFSTPEGRQVLQHLLDRSYLTVCESTNPIDLAAHNGRRSVIHDLLINLDLAESPDKYTKEPYARRPDDRTDRFSVTRDSASALDL